MALVVVVLGVLGPFVATSFADVRDTKHNLVKRPGQQGRDVDSKDVCVFCHFPSVGAPEDAAPGAAPKWQRSVSMSHAFPIYDDIGRSDLKEGGAVGSQSVACLACHDSNQAFAVTALSYDHPFGVPYRGARATAQVAGTTREAPARQTARPLQFGGKAVEPEFRPAFEGTIDGRKIFWASRQAYSYRRGKTDLPLYGRHDEEGGEIVPYVECTSCHDPHSSNPLFLRISNSGNQLCLTCHDK